MNHLAEAPTAESPLFVRNTVFEAHDCRVEVIRSGRDGCVLAVVVEAREGVSVGHVEPNGCEARGARGEGRGR